MQRLVLAFVFCLITAGIAAQKAPTIYVDKSGVMRWNNTQQEASFFGVNYTLPFAHAYRAIGYLNKDHKEAIDKDVYHFARLGFNAYRIHIWDVEISDNKGNLLANNHLDLMDYLIYKLKERNIKIVLTTMTNFGNGYPERNQPTDGFSYLYDKCEIHDNPQAQKAQQTYIAQLVKHVNPYTGNVYMNDPDIVGFEINNEPCHAGTRQQTREYINGMLSALKKAGNRKPVFYNVSHNMHQIEAYYATDIQGTTYQWYPIGLVAGQTRKGNFLPYIDNFHIPFSNTKGFASKARLVYEYDPADITYSYMHPAMARSFRTAGFQWITQFAYDPIDMARYNTEYQTHLLNLAYTPQKAISMKIAAEVAYNVPRNQSYGVYPADTIFNDFRVSYMQDLSEMNNSKKFFYSNHTTTLPAAINELEEIVGYGNSPVVSYEGTGAYFLDKLEEGVWRLEVMPDAVQIRDPFAKPNLEKEVITIMWNKWNMQINLPNLGNKFNISALNKGNSFKASSTNGVIENITPGVYLLQKSNHKALQVWDADTHWKTITLGEYVAPEAHADTYFVSHTASKVIESDKPYIVEAEITGPAQPDSVIIYTDKISFWNNNNPYYKMERVHGYTYRATIPAKEIQKGVFRYNIIVCRDNNSHTFPSGVNKNPLDWDYISTEYWNAKVVDPGSAIKLFEASNMFYTGMETYSIPEGSWLKQDNKEAYTYFLRKYIVDDICQRKERLTNSTLLCLNMQKAPLNISVGFVTCMGYTYKTTIQPQKGINKIPLNQLEQTATALLPHPYPVFLKEYFEPETNLPFQLTDIERVEISFENNAGEIEIDSIWIE
ncbi:hypothetical protein [Bacteroides sp. 519]|uniref:hypothetical protein n=1 Tax=Bacteroides sp. 519 TaxID=2302937 RepID=UPI0013D2256E|nr:hypothetical protein [Bacteroides sp. 519]NDV58250.1 hypothetical protein [Bacteroides sp. 519]